MATARRRPPPSAIVNPKHASGTGLPLQTPLPVQQQPPPQVAALQGGAVDPSAFVADPMSAMLLQRAERQEPIRGPVSLLGRLAALGVGQSIERKNTEARQAAVLDMIGSLPKEQQAMAKLAVLTGGDLTGALLTQSGQALTARGQDISAETSRGNAQLSADTAIRGQDLSAGVAGAKIEFDRDKFDADREAKWAQITETGRSNRANEQLKADKLEQDQANADAKMMLEEMKAKNVKLTESEGKAISLATQMAPALEILASPDFGSYRPPQEVQLFMNNLTTQSGPMEKVMVGLFTSDRYENFSEQDQRFIIHGLTAAEMALRDTSGATINAGEIAQKAATMLPAFGDSDLVLEEKAAIREFALEGIMAKIPPVALDALMARMGGDG